MKALTEDRIRKIKAGCEGVTKGPYQIDNLATKVWSYGVEKLPMLILDIRGWGHLTGGDTIGGCHHGR